MKTLQYIGLMGLTLSLTYAQAQEKQLINKSNYQYYDAIQLWQQTSNAAGLTRDPLIERGVNKLAFTHQKGSYHTTQDGNENNRLQFDSESYKRIGKYLYGYGRFGFEIQRQFGRAWSDVYRSHFSNPYFSGSSIMGKYDMQNLDFTASLATLPIKHFTFGMRLDYRVGDLSRLRDPRSRTQLADYKIAPSITYQLKDHVIGWSIAYQRRKEKIPNITTVQTDPNMVYYLFNGMEHASAIIGGHNGFEREFVEHRLHTELSYQFHHGNLNTLLTLGTSIATENVWGDNKFSPGIYKERNYHLSLMNRFRTHNGLHHLDIGTMYRQGVADEYLQQKTIVKDPLTGIESQSWNTLLTYNIRYSIDEIKTKLHYRYDWLSTNSNALSAFAGLQAEYLVDKEQMHLPHSERNLHTTNITMELGKGLNLQHNRQLWLNLDMGYLFNIKSELQLNNITTDLAKNVLIPDQSYYGASAFHSHLSLTYTFPIKLKSQTNTWFINGEAGYVSTNRHTQAHNLTFGIGFYH